MLGESGDAPSLEVETAELRQVHSGLYSEQTVCGMAIRDLVNPGREDKCIETPNVDGLAQDAASVVRGDVVVDPEEIEHVHYLDGVSLSEKLRSLVIVLHLLENEDRGEGAVAWALRRVQRTLKS